MGVLHVRVDHTQGGVGMSVAGVSTATCTTLSACEGGRASGGVGDEADTVGGRVFIGLTRIMTGFNT